MDDMKQFIESLPSETDIRNFIQGRGIRFTDLSFAIANSRGFDVLTSRHYGERFFIYRAQPEEDKVLSLFEQLGIPHFLRIEKNSSYSVVKLPTDTRALDMMKFSEKRPTDGAYLGAFEIMAELGKFLKRLQASIDALPQNLSIASFAIVSSENGLVRLVPPLLMGEILPPQTIETQLLDTFKKIDPQNNHRGQVQELMRNYL